MSGEAVKPEPGSDPRRASVAGSGAAESAPLVPGSDSKASPMTYREALKVPLVFGNPRSICAADTIQAVREALAFAREHVDDIAAPADDYCDSCDGTGERECDMGFSHDCDDCDGDTSAEPVEDVNEQTVQKWTAAKARQWLADMRERFR